MNPKLHHISETSNDDSANPTWNSGRSNAILIQSLVIGTKIETIINYSTNYHKENVPKDIDETAKIF